jgi:kynurenine formamidase
MRRFAELCLVGVVCACLLSRIARTESFVIPTGNEPDPFAEFVMTFVDITEGRATLVDLTYTLNDKSPYWPGPKYQPFQFKTIATIEKDGVLSKTICMPEHLGTHIDAPNHFEKGQPSVEKIKPVDLISPGVVIDIRAQCEANADYALSVADVKAWEKKHSRIPDRAVVFLNTGWSRFWTNFDRYKNQDARGTLHFPGYSAAAATFLVKDRKAKGLGIDTLSIDVGTSKKFEVHHVVNGAGRYGLENVANLDRLPARGFYVVVAPIKIETGSGGPTRIFAFVPKR